MAKKYYIASCQRCLSFVTLTRDLVVQSAHLSSCMVSAWKGRFSGLCMFCFFWHVDTWYVECPWFKNKTTPHVSVTFLLSYFTHTTRRIHISNTQAWHFSERGREGRAEGEAFVDHRSEKLKLSRAERIKRKFPNASMEVHSRDGRRALNKTVQKQRWKWKNAWRMEEMCTSAINKGDDEDDED